jgi:hypothetical protein
MCQREGLFAHIIEVGLAFVHLFRILSSRGTRRMSVTLGTDHAGIVFVTIGKPEPGVRVFVIETASRHDDVGGHRGAARGNEAGREP